ncbi:PilW family protein [Haloferula sp. A504]|uniref:PilW family protein n=1 Tax=Haloferula sp. A504 TaxID=3373601 RepID=UPI0031C01DC9|nr:prepilin-type N-terminal cleavage/methylation domain-containing protein [Verrucomicrobiaceae bacterium E54]
MRTRAGFTLVELIVSMAIGSIVLLLAVGALRAVGEGYGRGTDGVAAEREARAVLTQAAEDLSKAVGGREMVFEQNGEGWHRDRLGFFCLQPPDAQSDAERVGDLCAVVYYVSDIEMGGDTVRCMMRGFRGSGETFEALRAGEEAGLFLPDPADEPVAFGVVSFEMKPLLRDATGWTAWRAEDDPGWNGPDAVAMRIVVARRELSAKLRDSAAWDASPLLGEPDEAELSDQLEIYEILQHFAHAS